MLHAFVVAASVAAALLTLYLALCAVVLVVGVLLAACIKGLIADAPDWLD
jgi:hypothetical protein